MRDFVLSILLFSVAMPLAVALPVAFARAFFPHRSQGSRKVDGSIRKASGGAAKTFVWADRISFLALVLALILITLAYA